MTREEAIKILASSCIPGSKQTEALETLIPELRESEDERIREEIVDYFKKECECLLNDFRDKEDEKQLSFYKKALAWLEKQKEQKPSGETNVEPSSKIPREEYLYHLLANDIITFSDYTYLIAKKPFDYECANIPQKDYTPVEQKPAEWSESDKQNINLIISYLDSYIEEHNNTFGADECKYLQYWLKSLPLNLKKKNEDVAKLCSNEWSEEDERMLSRCIKSIETSKQFADSYTFKVAKDKEIAWLKSLTEKFNLQSKQEWSEEDRLHYVNVLEALEYVKGCKSDYDKIEAVKSDIAWFISLRPSLKPSEEQMKALLNAEGFLRAGLQHDSAKTIAELYEQLKKLRS